MMMDGWMRSSGKGGVCVWSGFGYNCLLLTRGVWGLQRQGGRKKDRSQCYRVGVYSEWLQVKHMYVVFQMVS